MTHFGPNLEQCGNRYKSPKVSTHSMRGGIEGGGRR